MTNKSWMGIDPGLRGGIAIISSKKIITVFETPLTPTKELDIDKILEEIGWGVDYCFIEKAQPMPKQGVVGVFNYGKGYGILLGILQFSHIPYQEIRPTEWKKHFGLIKSTKEDSIAMAMELFPQLPEETFFTSRGRKKDGAAEALLLAEYCRRKMK